jgi:hypothetical protein
MLAGATLDRTVVTAATAGAGCLAAICGFVLLARRLAGGVTLVPNAGTLAAVGIAGSLLVTVGDLAARMAGRPRPMLTRVGFLIAALATALPLPLSRPGTAAMGIACVVCASILLVRPRMARRLRLAPQVPVRVAPRDERPASAPVPVATPWSTLPAPASPDEHLLQRQERVVLPDGGECVRGRLVLTVAAGARNASGHVGFCPPFAMTPTVDVSTAYDDVEAVVAAAEVLPWGIRVECRLDDPADEALEIPIDILAAAPPCSPSPLPSRT